MKRIARSLFVLALTGVVTAGCSKEDVTEEIHSLDVTQSIFEGQQIQQNQLLGSWKIHSINSDVAVDLNADGNSSKNVLQETSCFNNMYFDFNAEGKVETLQGRISFPEGTMVCGGDKVYTANYSVTGNDLTVFFTLNGEQVQASKTIGLSQDATGEYLHVSLEDVAVEEFISDPGNTVVSGVKALELIFVKE